MTVKTVKSFLKSRTFWLGIVAIIIGILQRVLDLGVVEDSSMILIMTGLLGILLRFKTDEPIELSR